MKKLLLWGTLTATLTLTGCDMINSLLGNEPPATTISPLNTWITGDLPTDSSSRTYRFEVTPGHDYYLNWNDVYVGTGYYEADILVAVTDSHGTTLEDQWGNPLDATYATYDGGDSGYVGVQGDGGDIPSGTDVDFTRIVSVASGTQLIVKVIPFDDPPALGQFQIRLRTSVPEETQYNGGQNANPNPPVAANLVPAGSHSLGRNR